MMVIVITIILLLITTQYINRRNRCDTIAKISCTSIDSIHHLHYLMYYYIAPLLVVFLVSYQSASTIVATLSICCIILFNHFNDRVSLYSSTYLAFIVSSYYVWSITLNYVLFVVIKYNTVLCFIILYLCLVFVL